METSLMTIAYFLVGFQRLDYSSCLTLLDDEEVGPMPDVTRQDDRDLDHLGDRDPKMHQELEKWIGIFLHDRVRAVFRKSGLSLRSGQGFEAGLHRSGPSGAQVPSRVGQALCRLSRTLRRSVELRRRIRSGKDH